MVINEREDVAVIAPGSVNTIVLSGNDLALLDETSMAETRVLTLKGTFNDRVLGNNLPINDAVKFVVDRLAGVE